MPHQVNISSLDFQEIRNNLISYLDSDQSLFKSYPFEGSALSTLIDVLAYNTLYYGFYSNMVANETFLDTAQLQTNITALLKPLGYIVNGMNCSRLPVTVSNRNLTAYSTTFSANSGVSNYNFYPIKNYLIPSGETQEIELYEAESVIIINDINSANLVQNQSYFINDPDIDINTIRITVNNDVWERYSPTVSFYKANNKIYFIDRTDDGFYVLFSKYNNNDVPGLYGNQIKNTDVVKLEYLKPTGENANGAILAPSVGITALRASGGGGRPDLNLIKTFVPKIFASAERAITKDDYYGLIYEQASNKGLITSLNHLVVWGGEELDPPIYGRIFYSINDPALLTNSVKDITLAIKEKGMITVDLEYVPATYLPITCSLKYTGSANQTSLLNAINSYFSVGDFNKIFSISELISHLRTNFSSTALSNLTVNDLKITIVMRYGDTTLNVGTAIGSVQSSTFQYDTYSNAYIKSVGFNLNLYSGDALIREKIGFIDSRGIISVNNDIISSTVGSISITVTPSDKTAPIIAKNQYILTVNTTLSKT